MLNLEIKKIDIKDFGCYKDYKQHHSQSGIGNDFNDGRVNIFYGRNYSGKSTYSKIFQSIELKQLPEKYGDIDFAIKLANQTFIKSNEIATHTLPIDCKVFNQRFIDDNIYLHNDNKLNSFQISIGSDTNETLKKIEDIRLNELKPRNEKLSQVESNITEKQKKNKISKDSLDSKLRTTASKIKNLKNPSVVVGNKYDIRDIKEELSEHSSQFPILPSQSDKDALAELEKKIKQAKIRILEKNIKKPQKIDLVSSDKNFNFTLFLENTKKLLSKVVSVSNILDEYKNSSDKINWIKHGIDIHGDNPEKCVFCGNSIDGGFIKNLKLAFSDELSSLENELVLQNNRVKSEIQKLNSIPNINKEDYFNDSAADIQNINKDIKITIDNRRRVLETLESKILEKQRDIFSKIEINDLNWSDFSEIQVEIIFYIYNLIFCLLEKKEFLQYFLSTHNLDFLKYTNKFSVKKDYYLIEKTKEAENIPSKSYIKKLPKHLSNKVTEFVFLFEQIYRVATEKEAENNFSVFYNFPNNGRKFIETLLYFKYPDYKTKNDDKINSYFGNENAAFIQRINNEYSHGEDRFDRTRNPINTSEFIHDARIILSALYQNDPEQFTSFLNNSNLTLPDFLEER